MKREASVEMTKEHIIEEIKRTAAENGGVPLGLRSFTKVTGIPQSRWYGRYWRSWGDAVQDAGFVPNRPTDGHGREALVLALTKLAAKLERFPTRADVMLERRADPTFAGMDSYEKHIGKRAEMIEAVRAYASDHHDYTKVLAMLLETEDSSGEQGTAQDVDGAVYMLKLGRHYKIGKSYRVPRRHQEIAIELPEKPEVVHVITTDDPTGIEAYWHKRFAEKHTNGEWFALTRAEVSAFKRRRFM